MSEEFDLGDGLVLRKVRPEDANELWLVVDDNREYLRAWMPWADLTLTVRDTAAFIERSQRQDLDGRGFQCVMRLEDTIVGMIGHVVRPEDRWTDLGYWIAERYQGMGLVTRAARALIDHVFTHLGLNRVEISAGLENLRSRAVAERLGFRLEGILREHEWVNDRFVDHAVYGMLARDWRSGRGRAPGTELREPGNEGHDSG